MPGLGTIQEFMSWLFEAYGALSSILILLVTYFAWRLHEAEKDLRTYREHLADALEKSVETQLAFRDALYEGKEAIKELKETVEVHNA